MGGELRIPVQFSLFKHEMCAWKVEMCAGA
ncbi:hypothetical protein LINPERPRIM_LOCUS15059, partial [Linum perenne]